MTRTLKYVMLFKLGFHFFLLNSYFSYMLLMKFNDVLWTVEDCVERHAPIKKLNKKQVERSMKPWITNEIINMIGHRDGLFHQKKDNPLNQRIKSAYNLFRNRVTREIKKAKKSIIMITLKII